MSWSDAFPVFTDEMVDEFESSASAAEKAEMEELYGVEKIFNAQDKPHVVGLSLFWKHSRASEPDLPPPTLELIKNAKELGLVRRFTPWDHYVEPLLREVPHLKALHPHVVFRVYLAHDLDFLIPDLVEAGCEVHWMKSSSIRQVPGALWRFLPFDESGKSVTVADVDLIEKLPVFMERTEIIASSGLGFWRCPLMNDFGPDGSVSYLPLLACHLGGRGGIPVRKLLDAFTWHCLYRQMPAMVKVPGGEPAAIQQARWPDYGFDEWFLTAAVYPRVADSGVLTFCKTTDRSLFLLLDIEYVTSANPLSQMVFHSS